LSSATKRPATLFRSIVLPPKQNGRAALRRSPVTVLTYLSRITIAVKLFCSFEKNIISN
jgi:hypothetical protein